jgi:hypothetical protein
VGRELETAGIEFIDENAAGGNEFDMVREMARLIDSGKSSDEIAAEIRRMFLTATAADFQRTKTSADALFPKPDNTKS